MSTPIGHFPITRGSVYLDAARFENGARDFIVEGEVSGVEFALVFEAVSGVELRDWEMWDEGSSSSFNEVVQSSGSMRRFVLQTYDVVFIIACKGHSFGEAMAKA
ncbi:MAG: hypothetical protein KDI51_16870 [Xanthomonadales bacterium]|nr:hypothetical protein [Xanthomonadales bacterium]